MSATSEVLVDVSDGVATVTLDRPDSLNSLTDTSKTALLAAVRQVADDASIRALVLTGAGRGFCVGQDLREHAEQLGAGSKGPFESVSRYYNPIATTLAQMPKPVIAAVNGVAAGAGLSLAMLADFRIAAPTAKFTTAFAGIGLSCDTGASWSLQRLVGSARARELLFDARTIDADEALRIGLVNRVYDDQAALLDGVFAIAREIAAKSPIAVAGTKEMLSYMRDHRIDDGLDYIATWNAAMLQSEDLRVAVAAHMSKQKPTFAD